MDHIRRYHFSRAKGLGLAQKFCSKKFRRIDSAIGFCYSAEKSAHSEVHERVYFEARNGTEFRENFLVYCFCSTVWNS
jgi:hypothetical protein